MNIKKALKEKNKLVAKITESYIKVSTYNSVVDGSERSYDPKISLDEWKKSIDELVVLKTRIHKANSKVYDKIFLLSELKSFVKQLKQIDCTSGKKVERYGNEVVSKTTAISLVERDNLVKEYESQIESIQEELDTHNSKTKI